MWLAGAVTELVMNTTVAVELTRIGGSVADFFGPARVRPRVASIRLLVACLFPVAPNVVVTIARFAYAGTRVADIRNSTEGPIVTWDTVQVSPGENLLRLRADPAGVVGGSSIDGNAYRAVGATGVAHGEIATRGITSDIGFVVTSR